VLTVDEDRAQTQAIHRLQREQQTIEGLLARKERERILKIHRNAQRLLKPLFVANPYAPELTFPDRVTRTRRDHVKYLTLIASIALLHQYQREVKSARGVSYIEATREDIATADRLIEDLLGRSLDELPPQTRRLLSLIEQMISEQSKRLKTELSDYRFSRRQVRDYTGWGMTQTRVHLDRLVEMEYLIPHRGSQGQFVYELNRAYDSSLAAPEGHLAGGWRPPGGGVAGGWRGHPTPITTGSRTQYAAAKA